MISKKDFEAQVTKAMGDGPWYREHDTLEAVSDVLDAAAQPPEVTEYTTHTTRESLKDLEASVITLEEMANKLAERLRPILRDPEIKIGDLPMGAGPEARGSSLAKELACRVAEIQRVVHDLDVLSNQVDL